MSYIGVQPTAGQYRQLDDISGSFNGATVTFTTSVGGLNVTAGSAEQLLVSLGGVIQNPGADYSVSTNSITFSTAPASGLDFFAVLMGDAVNVGTPADGSVTSVKLASDLTVDLASGTVSAPSLTFDANTGLYSPGADEVAITTNGTEALRVDSSGRLLVGTSSVLDVLGTQEPLFQVYGTSDENRGRISIAYNNAESFGPGIHLNKSPGTLNALVSDDDQLGAIFFEGGDGVEQSRGASIEAYVDGTPGVNDMPGRLVFSTTPDGDPSPTERMRISSDGKVGINDDTDGYAELLQIDGTGNTADAYCLATKVGSTASRFHVRFSDTTGVIGSITSSAGTVAYNPFLGCHWGRLENGNRDDIPVGTILETVDKEIQWNFAVFQSDEGVQKIAWNGTEAVGSTVEVEFEGKTFQAIIEPESVDANVLNKHVCVKVSDTLNSPGVFGVFLGYDSDEGSTNFIGSWNDLYAASVGNFFIRIDKDETVAIGDLIASGGNGCGIVQQSDVITNKTVGKVTSTKKHKIYEDGSYLVTCVLYCG